MKTQSEHLMFLIRETQLKTFIKNSKGYYIVSSVYTLDAGFETMVFPTDEKGTIIDYGELDCVHYNTYSEMVKGHKKICKKWSK